MKIRLLLLMVLLTCVYNVLLAENPFYIQPQDGVTEVTILFLVPLKNFGILWDNSSPTKADDIRQPHPHSSLQLFSKKGNFPGMLKKRFFRIKLIPYEKPTALSVERKDGVLIKYNGYHQAIFLQPKS